MRIGEKYNFHGENFHGLLTFAAPKDATPANFTEKTFVNNHKTTKFAKVFSLKSFLLSGVCMHLHNHSGSLTGLQLLNCQTQSYLSWLAVVLLSKRSFVRHFSARGNLHPFNPLTYSQTSLNCPLKRGTTAMSGDACPTKRHCSCGVHFIYVL